ncbi:hypothetical protein K431DRAFT_284119 [Polychaeton citri CBS 116435]|uniref:Gfd2/YDR514C-like C-terminal domain-containing protein n=1 Tax=Polychaeton citri CBS 116435 TaxID=1314669 RepID=A0A9P4UPV2_9PEZI|nr:hypothetical protein K431DRAFT_284119 [Polychaeton citri CBS 116435]
MNHGTITRTMKCVESAAGIYTLRRKPNALHRPGFQPTIASKARLLHSKQLKDQSYSLPARDFPEVRRTTGSQRSGASIALAYRHSSTKAPKLEQALPLKPRWNIHRYHLDLFGSIQELQLRLGLVNGKHSSQRRTVFVSIDTETERLGLLDYVSEVGMSILDTRDFEGISPGLDAADWLTRMRTMHWRVDHNNLMIKKRIRGDHCFFCKSENATPRQIQDAVLHHLYAIKSTDSDPVDLVLVGHTIDSDIQALSRRPLFLKLKQAVTFAQTFDTVALAASAEEHGARFDSRSLGSLLPILGLESKYCRTYDGMKTLRGWHNSGNDAAYTMMLLMRFGLRWQELTEGTLNPRENNSFALGVLEEEMH